MCLYLYTKISCNCNVIPSYGRALIWTPMTVIEFQGGSDFMLSLHVRDYNNDLAEILLGFPPNVVLLGNRSTVDRKTDCKEEASITIYGSVPKCLLPPRQSYALEKEEKIDLSDSTKASMMARVLDDNTSGV